jgi:hypothetical protein
MTLGVSAGLGGMLLLHHPPAIHAQRPEVNVLTTANYLPNFDLIPPWSMGVG